MENIEIITTDKMIELGFSNKPRTFQLNGMKLKKHPTMNWLIIKGDYLKTMAEVYELIKSNQ